MKRFKKITSVLLAAAMTLSLTACGTEQETTEETTEEIVSEVTEEATTEEPVTGNQIENGDFSNGTDKFNVYTNGGNCNMNVNADGELQVDISESGDVAHGVQIYYDGFEMTQGVVYEFSFDVHATIDRPVEWRVQINGGDYHAYAGEIIDVTEEVQHISSQFTMEEASDPAPRLCFNMGCVDALQDGSITSESMGTHSVMLDNLSLEQVDDSGAVADAEAVEVPKAKVNQVGYKKDDTKLVVFSDLEEGDNSFTVVDVESGESVYEGKMTEQVNNAAASEMNCSGDFTAVKTAGTYKIVTGKGEESYPFVIGDNVYDETFKSIVKMLYLQRCGVELDKSFAGDFSHPLCHGEEAVIYGTNTRIDVSGGWHDAGDYGRYVVSGAKAVADLLLAYEKNPEAFGDDCGIPESGDGINDALQEAKYELDWMLKMQDNSGGVYHKVTCKVFPETVMPEEETDELVVAPLSKTATADFAAVMAMAGRIFGEESNSEYKDYGNTCLEAAKKAWTYYEEHKDERGFVNPNDIVTGEYGDGNSKDEYFWAAAELYKATEESQYKEKMAEALEGIENIGGLGWADVAAYGAYAALTTPILMTDSSNLLKDIENAFFAAAENALQISKENGYMVSREGVYEWGSNMGIANNGMLLCLANEIRQNEEYITCAKNHLNYLFGMNATGYCFVTETGTLSPKHPHHRPSQALGKCMPGMLVGGPDSALEDPYAKAVLSDTPAAKCYADNEQSYSCNEVTIYWNSPLIYLLVATQD
ncbi:MAG: glycoside hydrolase family 9 protein [Lachnospiraceae bacterium]|nr:glycoside hydrolase family 9 protein [Lachnospiraceae bacterium]